MYAPVELYTDYSIPENASGGATGRGQGRTMARGSGRTYTNTRRVGGAWGALHTTCTASADMLLGNSRETPYCTGLPTYPTPLLSPNPPGARCLPVHCVSHPFASGVLIPPVFAHSASRSASSFPGMRTCDRTCVNTIPGLSLCSARYCARSRAIIVALRSPSCPIHRPVVMLMVYRESDRMSCALCNFLRARSSAADRMYVLVGTVRARALLVVSYCRSTFVHDCTVHVQ